VRSYQLEPTKTRGSTGPVVIGGLPPNMVVN